MTNVCIEEWIYDKLKQLWPYAQTKALVNHILKEQIIKKEINGKTLFIMCKAKECFPEHDFENTTSGVRVCKKVLPVIGEINWD